jgi:hypothetical protein
LQHVSLLSFMPASCTGLTGCERRSQLWAAADCRVWPVPAAGAGAGKGELLC